MRIIYQCNQCRKLFESATAVKYHLQEELTREKMEVGFYHVFHFKVWRRDLNKSYRRKLTKDEKKSIERFNEEFNQK